ALIRNVDQEVMDMLPTSVKLVIGDVGDHSALRSVVEGCNNIIYCATARSSITVDLNRVVHQGVYNLSKGFQDYNNKLAQLRAGKSSKSKLLLAKFKSAESLNGCEVRKGTFFQDEATAKYDGGMDAKFEFSEWRCSYVFTRGYVDLSTKLSLPLGSTLDRYKGLILSIGGNGRSYVLILESGPTVRVPLSSFRPVNPADPPLDPFLIHTFTISFEPRRQSRYLATISRLLSEKFYQVPCASMPVHGVEHAFGAHEHSATGIFEVNDRKCSGSGLWRNCCGLSVGQPVLRRSTNQTNKKKDVPEMPADAKKQPTPTAKTKEFGPQVAEKRTRAKSTKRQQFKDPSTDRKKATKGTQLS
ncbi:hypothetical protein Tco_1269884, partial [Tanacetum coccineum]